jgi:Ni/Fe-hydrogenase 1 B-type cytochrome subunit
MAIKQPIITAAAVPVSIKKNSAGLRLWHWASMIIISGSLLTVLINSVFTGREVAGTLIKSELQKSGVVVTTDQSFSAANALEDSVWSIHIYFGYCLAGLLLFRIILEFFQVADQKFIRKFKSAYKQYKVVKKNRQDALHELGVKIIYAIFYSLLLVMAVTGLSLAFDDDIPALKSLHHPVKSVHGFCMYLILAFIVIHIVGVFLAERKKDTRGIVSGMINGGGTE